MTAAPTVDYRPGWQSRLAPRCGTQVFDRLGCLCEPIRLDSGAVLRLFCPLHTPKATL